MVFSSITVEDSGWGDVNQRAQVINDRARN